MYIPVVLGTAREGRQSEKVAKYVAEQVKKNGHETEVVDVRDYRLPASDKTVTTDTAKKWAAKVNAAAALIIVMPEYNHGYPGELKMMLDMLYKEYFDKPVGLCGVSNGPVGGARGLQALKLTLVSVRLSIILETAYFPRVQDLFDESGAIKDQSYDERIKGIVDSLVAKSKN